MKTLFSDEKSFTSTYCVSLDTNLSRSEIQLIMKNIKKITIVSCRQSTRLITNHHMSVIEQKPNYEGVNDGIVSSSTELEVQTDRLSRRRHCLESF